MGRLFPISKNSFFSLKNKKTLKAYMVKSGLSYYFLV